MVIYFECQALAIEANTLKKFSSMIMSHVLLAASANIIELQRISSTFIEVRKELFQKQVEITRKHCWDALLSYSWFPSSKE